MVLKDAAVGCIHEKRVVYIYVDVVFDDSLFSSCSNLARAHKSGTFCAVIRGKKHIRHIVPGKTERMNVCTRLS